jgi:hypothetical protein
MLARNAVSQVLFCIGLGACAGGPPSQRTEPDVTFVFNRSKHVTQIRVTREGLEGYRFSYKRDGEWMRGQFQDVHLNPTSVVMLHGEVDLAQTPEGLRLFGNWGGCRMDVTLGPKEFKGNLCGRDLSLSFGGESYTGLVETDPTPVGFSRHTPVATSEGFTQETNDTRWNGVSLHVPRIAARLRPQELAFALILAMTSEPQM